MRASGKTAPRADRELLILQKLASKWTIARYVLRGCPDKVSCRRRRSNTAGLALAWLTAALVATWLPSAWAQPTGAVNSLPQAEFPVLTTTAASASRPRISPDRWTENWSALADPALRTRPFDAGKYIPFLPDVPGSYVSLGLSLRDRWEFIAAPSFGIGDRQDSYLLHRLQAHADVHLDASWRAFVQVEDVRAPGKRTVTPVDENPLDLRLAFLEYTGRAGTATLQVRVGRQDIQFDLQRFLSSRDGPNVRQSFDAVWAAWDQDLWRVAGFASRPVQYSPKGQLDDRSNQRFRFSLLRVERRISGTGALSAYYALYERDGAQFLDALGNERRHVLDVRLKGAAAGFDWDLEAMGQSGTVGPRRVRAWAAGTRAGYTFAALPWQLRLGLQADAASGDERAGDGRLSTFNPLFPNGYYFNLAGFTGYSNLVHLKPSVTVSPVPKLQLALAVGLQWRVTTADAVYVQSAAPVPRTAGRGGGWTGAYAQVRADYEFNPNLVGAIEAVRFQSGSALRQAGGHNASYVGTELKMSW